MPFTLSQVWEQGEEYAHLTPSPKLGRGRIDSRFQIWQKCRRGRIDSLSQTWERAGVRANS